VLTGDLLFYHKSPQDSRPTGTIPLAGNRVIRHLDDQRNNTSFRFEIISGRGQQISNTHNTYLISADSAAEADEWVAVIRRVMHEPYGGGMFGRSLEETMAVETRLGGSYVPIFLHRCVTFLREHALHEVGIFRLPGQASRVQDLKELYDQGCQQQFSASEDVHTVGSLLKLYLRELPEPLVPFDGYSFFQSAVKKLSIGMEAAVEDLQRALLHLPKVNINVLKYLVRFLSEIQDHSEDNKMTALNLATVFGPNILRPRSADARLLMECNTTCTDFVCVAIKQQRRLFPSTSDEKPPKRLSIVFSVDELQTGWADGGRLVQRSLYNPQENSPKHSTSRSRRGSAPYLISLPQEEQQRKSGVVASMVQHFNLRSTRSVSQISGSLEISSPVDVWHTAGQKPGGPALQKLLALNVESNLVQPQSLVQSGLQVSTSSEDVKMGPPVPPTSYTNRFSGSGVLGPRSDTLSSDVIVNSISRELETLETRLMVVEEEACRYKKAARLWKARYMQERGARLAAEQRANGLQQLVDDTFQQFALDDSEDDSYDELSSGSNASTPLHQTEASPFISLPGTLPPLV
jgi:hypothetical protein